MKRLALLVAIIVIAIVGLKVINAIRLARFEAVAFGSTEPKRVMVERGATPMAICRSLKRANVITHDSLCLQLVERDKLGPKLKAGEYEFVGPFTPTTVLQKVVRGEVKACRVSFAEGLRVDEILPLLAASELGLSLARLQQLATDASFISGLNLATPSLEGALFPDTYLFAKGTGEEAVLRKLVERTQAELSKAPTKPGVTLSAGEALTLASIIEKETARGDERPRISCVFHNRLRMHMPLQTDPTTLYAKFLVTKRFSKNLTKDDLQLEHPYNTYTALGLPPGPIANAGSASLRAALAPIDCTDLYFVSKNDGSHVFCPDLECHAAAVQRYQKPADGQSTRR